MEKTLVWELRPEPDEEGARTSEEGEGAGSVNIRIERGWRVCGGPVVQSPGNGSRSQIPRLARPQNTLDSVAKRSANRDRIRDRIVRVAATIVTKRRPESHRPIDRTNNCRASRPSTPIACFIVRDLYAKNWECNSADGSDRCRPDVDEFQRGRISAADYYVDHS